MKDQKQTDEAREKFHALDTDGSGKLDRDELLQLAKANYYHNLVRSVERRYLNPPTPKQICRGSRCLYCFSLSYLVFNFFGWLVACGG